MIHLSFPVLSRNEELLKPPFYVPPSIISHPRRGMSISQILHSRYYPKSSNSIRLSADGILQAREMYYSLKGNLAFNSISITDVLPYWEKLTLAIINRASFFLKLSIFCPKSTRSYAVSTHLYVSITSISFLKFTWFILHIGFLILKLLKHSSNQEQSFLFQLS